jgi:hypothetical protein
VQLLLLLLFSQSVADANDQNLSSQNTQSAHAAGFGRYIAAKRSSQLPSRITFREGRGKLA